MSEKTYTRLYTTKAKEIGAELTFYLMNGVPLKGKVLSFDNFTLVLESEGKKKFTLQTCNFHDYHTCGYSSRVMNVPNKKKLFVFFIYYLF